MSHCARNFCEYCDSESFACAPGFLLFSLGTGCEISNEAKKNLKGKVTAMERSAGSAEGKCRDFVMGTGRNIKGIIYAVYRNSWLLA